MINTAIIGFGSSAQTFHLPFIQSSDNFSLKAIVSSKSALPAKLEDRVKCYASIEQLLTHEDLHLIIVTTPNHTHYELGKTILNAGLHLIMEKPVALTQKETEELTHLAKSNSCYLLPFHNRRFDGDFTTVRQLVNSGSLGDIKYFESRMDRFRPEPGQKWKEHAGKGTGLWFDLGPHLLDQALSLFGTPDCVTGYIANQRDGATAPDFFDVSLHYQDKLIKLGGSNLHAGPLKRFLIQGSKATYIKTGRDPQEQQLLDGVSPMDDVFGVLPEQEQGKLYAGDSETIIKSDDGSYLDFYQAMGDSILQNRPPPIRGEDAVAVAKFLEMAILSNDMGKTIKVRQYRN